MIEPRWTGTLIEIFTRKDRGLSDDDRGHMIIII